MAWPPFSQSYAHSLSLKESQITQHQIQRQYFAVSLKVMKNISHIFHALHIYNRMQYCYFIKFKVDKKLREDMAAAEDKKQIEMKEQIQTYLRKKDYYDILGVARNCQDTQIKKAYKKLALRFHPDKNRVQGAKEVFKKVSNAYSNLIDQEKRVAYDRYGPQEDRAPQYRPRHNPQYRNADDEFQDIFRAFFGPGFRFENNRGNFHHYTFNMGGQRQGAQAQQRQQSSGFSFFYFAIFMFIIYVLPALFGPQKPYHSFQASSKYRYQMKTTELQTPFFVREQFFSEAQKDVNFKKNIEQTVDSEYLLQLKKECDKATYQKNKFVYQARQYSAGAYRTQLENRAKSVDLSACSIQKRLYDKNPEYIQNLMYYY